jgi:hypothetical protein
MLRILLVLGLGLIPMGCSEELGPVPLRVARVRGLVREGGRPISRGWIEFFPVDGTIGNLRSARLRADGSFEADGVAVGANLIRLVNPSPIESPMAARFRSFASPIRRTISDQPGEPITVDLFEETIRAQRQTARPRASGGAQPDRKEAP